MIPRTKRGDNKARIVEYLAFHGSSTTGVIAVKLGIPTSSVSSVVNSDPRFIKEGRMWSLTDGVDQAAEYLEGLKAGTDPKQRYGEKKPQLHLIPKAALDEMARALELGKRKYGERNWITGDGVQITTYLSAIGRHLALITDGTEDIDPESGAHHLGHIMAGCGIILDAMKHGKLIDNRVKP